MGESTRTTFDTATYFATEVEAHSEVVQRTCAKMAGPFVTLVRECADRLRDGGKLLLFGNGGSAADCQHIATELTVRYTVDRRAIAAIALTTDTSNLTAAGNDLGFERIFERQIEALGRDRDVAIGITTSGRSPNVLRGLEAARRLGLFAVVWTGEGGEDLTSHADLVLAVPSSVTARIQEMHLVFGHLLSGALERELGFVGDS
jgi:D-sedoheptulose 7-phosphate isomerase